MFNSKIVNQQGGSKLNLQSGASLTFAAGAQLGGTISGAIVFVEDFNQNAGSTVYPSGALTEYKAGACINYNVTGPSQTTFKFVNGTSTPSILVGTDAPGSLRAPFGSLYIRSSGSMSTLYINTTQDLTGGSTWLGFNRLPASA